jgi:hypothetical protein
LAGGESVAKIVGGVLFSAATVKAFANEACSGPVCTWRVLAPAAAVGSIVICAVAVVRLFTVTVPKPPSVAPFTVMPAPKLNCVMPFTKVEYAAVMFTIIVCPACPEFGDTETICAGGLTVKADVFPLANATPVEVDPDTETSYAVGVETISEEGIVKNTRRAEPEIVVTAVAVAVALGGPAVAGCSVTVTFPGGIVPLG